MTTEQELIKRILNGEKTAYSELVTQYERLVWHMVMRIIEDPEDVKDVCQEVFIQVFKKIKGFKFESKLATWIATIAWRFAINHQKKHHSHIYTDTEVLENLEQVMSDTPDVTYQRLDYQQKVQLLINALPIHYKTILTLYHINEFNYKEIEEITGFPEGTVKNYLFRARKLLKEKVEKTSLGKELKLN